MSARSFTSVQCDSPVLRVRSEGRSEEVHEKVSSEQWIRARCSRAFDAPRKAFDSSSERGEKPLKGVEGTGDVAIVPGVFRKVCGMPSADPARLLRDGGGANGIRWQTGCGARGKERDRARPGCSVCDLPGGKTAVSQGEEHCGERA